MLSRRKPLNAPVISTEKDDEYRRPAADNSESPRKGRGRTSPKKSPSRQSPTRAGSRSPKKVSTTIKVKRNTARKAKERATLGSSEVHPRVVRQASRTLSLSGGDARVGDESNATLHQLEPDDPCLPSGSRAFARIRSVGKSVTTNEEKTSTEDQARHFEATFHKTLMIVTERLARLERIFEKKRGYNIMASEHELELFANVVDNLSQAAIQLSIVAKVFDRKMKLATSGMVPDSMEEGFSQARYVLNKLTPYFDIIVQNLRKSKSKDLPLDMLIDGNNFVLADQYLSDAVQNISSIAALLQKK